MTLAAGTAVVGLWRRDVYRDAETFVDAGWLGNDLVILLLAGPVLAWATWNASQRPSARLVWLGALAFMLYNYAFYLFGAAPNRLLIAYIALVAMSLLALLLGLLALVPSDYRQPTNGERRFLLAYMALWAVGLALLWGIQAMLFAWSGDAPDLNGSQHAFRVTAALDLTLVVPYLVLAVILLVRRSVWALPVAAILNVKGILYPAVLIASSITASRAGVEGALTLLPLWTGFVIVSGVACWMLLRPWSPATPR
ncbi:MAG: hypothetical protein ACYC2H_04835 [Thermoplasmatota archaeon]